CMLKAAGIPLYQHLNVHGYWTLGGQKISKSIGNLVEALALKEKYGNDAFRYFVLREMVFGLDTDFSKEAFVNQLNTDLANDLSNLISRATTLIINLNQNTMPTRGNPNATKDNITTTFAKTKANMTATIKKFTFQRTLT